MSSQNDSTSTSPDQTKDKTALAVQPAQPLMEAAQNINPSEAASSISVIQIKTKTQSERPTWIEVFTGQAVVVVDKLFEAQSTTDKMILELREAQRQANNLLTKSKTPLGSQKQTYQKLAATNTEQLEQLEHIKTSIDAALMSYQWTL